MIKYKYIYQHHIDHVLKEKDKKLTIEFTKLSYALLFTTILTENNIPYEARDKELPYKYIIYYDVIDYKRVEEIHSTKFMPLVMNKKGYYLYKFE